MTDNLHANGPVLFQDGRNLFQSSVTFRLYFIGVHVEENSPRHQLSFGHEFRSHVRRADGNADIRDKNRTGYLVAHIESWVIHKFDPVQCYSLWEGPRQI